VKSKSNKQDKKNSKWNEYKWALQLALLAFAISVTFSFVSEVALKKTSLLVSTIIVLLFILIGVLFDMVGMAVATAEEAPFHSMSARKIKPAKVAVMLKRNAGKVSSFCNDVIGDICGIVSGSAGVVIATSVSTMWNVSLLLSSLITTGVIVALTIGGKAFEKTIAMEKSNEILYQFSKVLSIFYVNSMGFL